jgi:DNA-binding MarR family transcriptional regulator
MAQRPRARAGGRRTSTPKAGTASRTDLIRDVEAQWCALSAAMALFQTRSAAERGLTLTDLQAVDILEREDGVCASRLADQCGLTPGAITGMLDRLERAGVARRTRDAGDARRLVVRAAQDRPCRDCRVPPAFRRVVDSFDEADLQAIRRFLRESARALQRTTDRKRPDEEPRKRRRSTSTA